MYPFASFMIKYVSKKYILLQFYVLLNNLLLDVLLSAKSVNLSHFLFYVGRTSRSKP